MLRTDSRKVGTLAVARSYENVSKENFPVRRGGNGGEVQKSENNFFPALPDKTEKNTYHGNFPNHCLRSRQRALQVNKMLVNVHRASGLNHSRPGVPACKSTSLCRNPPERVFDRTAKKEGQN
jgi:hypothetical protein